MGLRLRSKEERKALDALDRAIRKGIFSSMHLRQPGAIVAKLTKEDREALEHLTSDMMKTHDGFRF